MARLTVAAPIPATREVPASRGRASWGSRSVVALAGLFGLFLGLPVVALVARAVVDGWLARALTAQVVLSALALSLATTAISLVLTVAFGLPLALVLARRRFRGSGWVEAIVDLPIVLPPAVAGLAALGDPEADADPLAALGNEVGDMFGRGFGKCHRHGQAPCFFL